MRGQHRLGPLHVRVAGQDHVGVGSQRPTNARCRSDKPPIDLVDRLADPQSQVGRDLIVAAAGGVQLAADVAEAIDQGLFDVHVDVFQFGAERESPLLNFPADFAQRLFNLPAFIGREQANLGQHLGMSREPSMSCAYKRRSKLTLSVNSSTRRSVATSKTPPQAFCTSRPSKIIDDAVKINNLLSLTDLRRFVNEAEGVPWRAPRVAWWASAGSPIL